MDRSNNVTYNTGPDRSEVENHVGITITPVAIKESNASGQNVTKNQLQIYKPQVQKNVNSGTKPAPSNVVELKDVKPTSTKTGTTTKSAVNQPGKQQPAEQQQKDQPAKEQPSQQPQIDQPGHQQSAEPQKTNQPKNGDKAKQPKQSKSPKNTGEENPPK